MNAIDTNVLIYAYDQRDPRKSSIAQDLLADIQPFALIWQVGCEFIAASRKLAQFGFTENDAWAALDEALGTADELIVPSAAVWSRARALQARLHLHFWDSLLVASCLEGSVATLYSEDFGSRDDIDGLRIINPFL